MNYATNKTESVLSVGLLICVGSTVTMLLNALMTLI